MANIYNILHSPVSDVFENGAIKTAIDENVPNLLLYRIFLSESKQLLPSEIVGHGRQAEGHVTLTE